MSIGFLVAIIGAALHVKGLSECLAREPAQSSPLAGAG
jgi:hypothetical protein